MKRRFLFIGIAFVLVTALTTLSLMLAAEPVPFNADGTITYITPGDVLPASESERWVIAERDLYGTLAGDMVGEFALTYTGNVESIDTQIGNIHSVLVVGQYVLDVTGNITFEIDAALLLIRAVGGSVLQSKEVHCPLFP